MERNEIVSHATPWENLQNTVIYILKSFQGYFKWKKSDMKGHILYDLTYVKYLEQLNP